MNLKCRLVARLAIFSPGCTTFLEFPCRCVHLSSACIGLSSIPFSFTHSVTIISMNLLPEIYTGFRGPRRGKLQTTTSFGESLGKT
ncbi:hypothetical protein GGU11DRAFT_792112 [Lentinula aff. detonsa]|nr:hypothetical protein GGU11DRAFT_792112 [Lentinula aff. detonsa]